MWVAIAAVAAGILAWLTAISTRMLETWAEGSGTRERRALVADLELLKSLPPHMASGGGAKALEERIDRKLSTYADSEQSENDYFERTGLRLHYLGLLGRGITAVMFVVLALTLGNALGKEQGWHTPWNWAAGFALSLAILATAFGFARVLSWLLDVGLEKVVDLKVQSGRPPRT